MNRREAFVAISASGAAGLLGLSTQVDAKPAIANDIKGHIVINLFVGQLPPHKAVAFIERVKDQMVNRRHALNLDNWPIIVMPTRNYEKSNVEVYVIDKNQDPRPVERLIYDTQQNLLLPNFQKHTDEQIREYVKMMLGYPYVELPSNIDDVTDYFIDCGREYNIHSLKEFVFNMVQDDYQRELTAQGAEDGE